jgi:SusD family.
VKLKPDTKTLKEVVVKTKKKRYTRKENPAVELMKRVIAAKHKTDLSNMTVNTKQAAAYGPGDSRRQASIIDCQQLANYEKSYLADQREYTGYAIKKYTPLSKNMTGDDGKTSLVSYLQGDMAGDFQISQYQDWVLVRYSDVLLMAAELGSTNAQTYFDDVRKRAYTLDDGTLSGNYVNLSATRENIWNERKKEFAFEGLRYWDELRQGLQSASTQIAESNTVVLSGGVKEYVNIAAQDIINKRGFCQIPITQITLSNGVLKQNPGW